MLERLMAVASRIDELLVVVDHPQNVVDLSSAAKARGARIGALVDIDVGQHRTGVIGPKEAVEMARAVRDSGLDYRGVQAYYGHLQHVSTYAERVGRVNEQIERLKEVMETLEGNELKPEIVSGGGTGTFNIDLENRVFTELQVGSYLFMDSQYASVELTPDDPQPFEHALFVQANVVSTNQPGLAVINAGWKAFSTEDKTPKLHDGAPLDTEYRWMGDEHGGLQISEAAKPDLGSRVEFIPNHCDPTVNLYRTYHCIRGDTLVDLWPIDGNGY
jgi:D-serine deaminase-like pyridoxal phosphate-dependent protein